MLIRNTIVAAAATVMLAFTPYTMHAQFAGKGPRDNFRDTTVLRPPAGSKVAIIVFEDLGCPACAHAHPIERQVAEQYHVPLVRYDFPLAQHIWTFDGAVNARYLQDKVSPKLADEYRSAVFVAQMSISSKDDLRQFTDHWMQQHGQKMPPVIDPGGLLAREVQADYDLGKRLNVEYTPTLVVVTRNNYQVVGGTAEGPNDPTKLAGVVEGAIAQTKGAAAGHGDHAAAGR
ncbi:thioredoxin domain-containing protein [Edaphobacter paludis]|uniref:Thioredoxin domain-containing protein n=1 Tax=Edaphobacter paludis TaxID=3035702 RepID=A0AAU7DA52_9BACT